jgi:hypothetical protein
MDDTRYCVEVYDIEKGEADEETGTFDLTLAQAEAKMAQLLQNLDLSRYSVLVGISY